ncbi:MAG: acyl-CoA reductase-like NAD-dependent aldehyde dehydrogenase [Verrucomicrobiales bacterium]|jgi:acyl-CoA reductase-like NAD-dependent aldehyde dehydrogenase
MNPNCHQKREPDAPALVHEKLQIVRSEQSAWAAVPVAERVCVLRKALEYFVQNREKVAADITATMGKPLSQSHNELNGFFDRATFLLSAAETTLAAEILPESPGILRRIEHVPLGVVFIISAWNYPLMISLNGVLAALLAGNTVLLKHASLTAEIGDHFEAAFGNIKGYSGILQHALTDHLTAGELIQQRMVDHVIFTGSVDGGRTISSYCGEAMLDCHLELGGKDAAYVASDADPGAAAESVVDGCMYNAGQSCCGIERVYVHAHVFDAFVARTKELIQSYKLGDPTDTTTTMGPLAEASAADAMEGQIDQARSSGADIALGGQRQLIDGRTFFAPTLVLHPTADMAIMREENFGPIMPVMKVQDDDEAVTQINDSNFGLTAAVFTTSLDRAESLAARIEAGTVYMNRCDILDPALPWTGYKLSGRGSGLSHFAFYGLTKRKAIHFKPAQS